MATKFYRCRHCGNVIQKVVDRRVPVVCCGEKMEELVPGTVDASVEKHLPVVTWIDGNTIKVEVGSVYDVLNNIYQDVYVDTAKKSNDCNALTQMIHSRQYPDKSIIICDSNILTNNL